MAMGARHDQANPSPAPGRRDLRPAVLEPAVHGQIGFYADGTPGEVFIDSGKTGGDVEAVARDAAVTLRLGLQHGVPIESTAEG